MFRSRSFFFNKGLTNADLQLSGNTPDWREQFTISLNTGANTLIHCLTKLVGIGAIKHDLLFIALITLHTSPIDRSLN